MNSYILYPQDERERAYSTLGRSAREARRYARVVTPEGLADLAHLRRARDLIDREYARPLDVEALARAALMSSAHFSRTEPSRIGETQPVPAP